MQTVYGDDVMRRDAKGMGFNSSRWWRRRGMGDRLGLFAKENGHTCDGS